MTLKYRCLVLLLIGRPTDAAKVIDELHLKLLPHDGITSSLSSKHGPHNLWELGLQLSWHSPIGLETHAETLARLTKITFTLCAMNKEKVP